MSINATKIDVNGLDEIVINLDRFPVNLRQNIQIAMNASLMRIHHEITQNATNKLHRRTGTLARGLQFGVFGNTLDNLEMRFWTNTVYASVQEGRKRGTLPTVIKAKDKYRHVPGGPYLNLPLPLNKTPAGVTRHTAGQLFKKRDAYIFKSKKNNWIVAQKSTNKPMFVLKKQVTIPPRLGAHKAFDNELPRLLSEIRLSILRDI